MSRNDALTAKAEMWEAATDYAKKHKVKMTRGIFKRLFQSSIYTPHQSERECARRRRQMERGILKVKPQGMGIFYEESGAITEEAWKDLEKK
ncbi:MAG: hypothetical protein V1784_12850 [bacterium]